MPGRDPRALLLDGRIHSGGNLLAGLVPLRTGGGETDGRPFPEVKRLLLAQETVVHAPEFGAVGLDREIEAKGIVKLVTLFCGLRGRDLDMSQHWIHPSKPV